MTRDARRPVETTITAYPGGPLLLRGPAVIVGEDGEPVERRRATVALCRCGRSRIAPWCDGSHKAVRRAASRRRAAEEAADR
jgi:CDGSH-type Zn-finger protein